VVTVVAVALFVEVGLRTLKLPRLAGMLGVRLDLESARPPRGFAPVVPTWGSQSATRVDRVMKGWPGGGTCLRRCLVLGQRLRGLDPVLRIGVQREADGSLVAHSWLEIDGESLDPTVAEFGILGAAAGIGDV
jgi:hypothetical protein